MKNNLLNISKYQPCPNSHEWYNSQESFKEAWENCHRGNWMLWLAFHLQINIKTLTLTKAYCAKTVYHLLKDDRSRNAIVTAINFGRGLATKEELDNAISEAIYAANAAINAANAATKAAAYAANATKAATYAINTAANATAYTAYAAAKATAYAAYATAYNAATTYTAAYTAYNADAAAYAKATAAKLKNQKKTADICRKYLTKEVFKILNL